ncbi:molybdopterin molybdotransferase MoeA [Oceanibacterium hippocampi]|uniref:Molybdopterin molybdenumtransferase n=1 Tax=Oceanibacterium hippocampi TaxID=745714 RepID=A0A1Y5T4X7_9PROT|nr:gephyrin-like molybdotransferase Glp [Oceanibacterium hippocampi]SLN54238.1 Molybdopterin molybdenumtransferase [Oceanibacterium hippocampi]
MISVEEARRRILAALNPTASEIVAIADADGRVLTEDVAARRTQPPADMSAMDGYAVRAADVATVPVTLDVIGAAPAGAVFTGRVGPGQAVRIFTGGVLPAGADTIVIQEDTEAADGRVTVREAPKAGAFVRRAGLDFAAGEVRLRTGTRLDARAVGLAAAMNVPWLAVRRKPRVALIATGDELVRPGEPIGESQIVASNTLALAALVRAAGGEAIDLGIARDNEASLRQVAEGARGADLVVTLGGASVGEHDLVRSVLGDDGRGLDFWKVAMRPGKPLMFGSVNGVPLLGLPGNPVSSIVCGLIYLRPAIAHMLGLAAGADEEETVRLARDLPENDRRQDYLRATLHHDGDGPLAEPAAKQDSSMLSTLAEADCLIVRAPHAPAASAGERVRILRFRGA